MSSAPNGLTAVVTGASRGIGRAIAHRLSADGYSVVAIARDSEQLADLCDELRNAGGDCRSLAVDVTKRSEVEAALAGIDADVLVNNAGIGIIKPFTELAADEWDAMIDVNINALFNVTRAVLPGMIARGRGQVCTIGSIAGRSAWAGGSCYSGTKAFVTAWSESLMLEVREHGIKVSVVMPGGVATDFGGHAPTENDAWKLTGDDVAAAVSHILAAPGNVLMHRLEIRSNAVPRRA